MKAVSLILLISNKQQEKQFLLFYKKFKGKISSDVPLSIEVK